MCCASDSTVTLASIGKSKGFTAYEAGELDGYTAEELEVLDEAQQALCMPGKTSTTALMAALAAS